MGQYYIPVLVNEKGEMKTFYSHNYDNGLKLMEHSWIGNKFVAAVMHELVNDPHRVWWLGDYAEIEDFKNKEHRLLAEDCKKAWTGKYNILPTDISQEWEFDEAYVINLDKKCYIKLPKVKDEWQICPLPLLTAVGNGKGGGDYRSNKGRKNVGTWAGDEIVVFYDLPDKYKDFTAKDYYFKED